MPQDEARLLGEAAAVVGEAPLWSAAEQALYWLDTMQRRLFRLRDGVTEQRDLPYRPSCLAPLEGTGLLVGYKKGIGLFDFESGRAVQLPIAGADLGEVSFNDGICDAAGRLWIGTRHREASAPVGALYKVDGDLAVTRMRDGLVVSNGIAFSPDGRRMYHADSRPGRIDAYDFDVRAGTLSAPRVLIDYAGKGRRPDGCTVDAEGFLWVAEIDGWRVARYDPEGRLVREIMLPVQKPSSVAFGGPRFETLFITSISYGLDAAARAAQAAAGRTMAIEPGVRGLPEHPFRGAAAAFPPR